jgi:serine protease inhibitor
MGRRIIIALAVLTIATAAFAALALINGATAEYGGGEQASPAMPSVPVAVDMEEAGRTFAAASNTLGMNLLREMRKGDAGNIVFSPLSVQLALGMTLNGAEGATAAQMRDAMALGAMPLGDANMSARWLINSLAQADESVELSLADSIWLERGLALNPDFAAACRDNYGAEVTETNLTSRFALKQMDDWVKAKTNGRIKSIIDPPVDDATALILLNAVYFKAAWERPFDKEDTRDDDFTLANGDVMQVKMMRQSSGWDYQENDSFQAVRMAYGDEERYGMCVFLPREGMGIDGLMDVLAKRDWGAWMDEFYGMEGLVGLPRFKAEFGVKLNDPLKALGMRDAFLPDKAQFTKMITAPSPLCIGLVMHKAFIEVNEAGTEAAAVTAVHGWATAAPGEEPKTFSMIARRPFLYAITDSETGAILFLGVVEKPEE